MKNKLNELFSSLGIEYYRVIPYSKCREISSHIIERESFTPRSAILYLLPYYTGGCENISAYAASLDYHIAIAEVNEKIAEFIDSSFSGACYRGYGDHSPIDECHAALISGLGILGDNGLIINEKYGSYVFVGDMITDIPASELGESPTADVVRCIGCGACKRACPTGILRREGSDCLSAITQRKGELDDFEIALMRRYNTAWGCDVCQNVCPYNVRAEKTPLEFFYRDRIDALTTEVIDAMDKETFSRRAFAWRGRKTVERNLEILKKDE